MAEKNQNDKTTKAKCLLRENFGLFATGVAVAATLQDGKSHFITINSLTSISLDPALLLFAIDNKSHKFESFTQNKNFSINLLTEDQIEISRLFSKVGDSEFDLEKLLLPLLVLYIKISLLNSFQSPNHLKEVAFYFLNSHLELFDRD